METLTLEAKLGGLEFDRHGVYRWRSGYRPRLVIKCGSTAVKCGACDSYVVACGGRTAAERIRKGCEGNM